MEKMTKSMREDAEKVSYFANLPPPPPPFLRQSSNLDYSRFNSLLTQSISKERGDSPMWFFLNKPKTLQDNEMTFYHYNFTPLRHILHSLTMLNVLRCCHGKMVIEK